MKIQDMIQNQMDPAALRRRLFPPRIVARGQREIDRISSDQSRNSSGGDYDEWHRAIVVSADPTQSMPSGMAFVGIGRGTGRAFYTYPDYHSSSEWYDMCPCCGTYQTTRGDWGFCSSCGGEDWQDADWQDAEGFYSARWSPSDGDHVQFHARRVGK